MMMLLVYVYVLLSRLLVNEKRNATSMIMILWSGVMNESFDGATQ